MSKDSPAESLTPFSIQNILRDKGGGLVGGYDGSVWTILNNHHHHGQSSQAQFVHSGNGSGSGDEHDNHHHHHHQMLQHSSEEGEDQCWDAEALDMRMKHQIKG